MNKYAIINGNKVSNIIIKDSDPTEGTFVDVTTNDLPISRDWAYDGSNFYSPLSYNSKIENIFSSTNSTIFISCSFTRNCNSITSDDLSSSDLDISNVNWDSSNNILSFTATTGSNFELGDTHTITFNSLHQDSLGYSWRLNPITIESDELNS